MELRLRWVVHPSSAIQQPRRRHLRNGGLVVSHPLSDGLVGMGTLTLSASVPAFKPPPCVQSVCPEASAVQYGIFFLGLYLIALGTGGIKPCVSSFGADQFDDTDPQERVKKGSFFN